ncbi:MAG: HAD family hydrolase [Parvibaculum sp.]|jgi:D-glycero-D-manno-heptose 1,7-bisphosphate phosphatase|uniref:D-glycero-alpha-D-manno-heptose-1,7-bisphosphate 7-phosphatase n=1 Tax=Parvibaculum sp. TaxID=2024848 RepID=UPI0028454BF3|nr:HAD family hydrolase [Parvibaculum sp.]MDR3499389.1 HAD family hydrolase [Parvibaculum sp.]
MPASDERDQERVGAGRRCLFLDRDGVINVDIDYLHRIEDCRFIDGIFETVAGFVARGFLPVIVTNQAGIGRGYYGEEDFARLMSWMRGEFARRGITIAAVYHCPDHPTEGIGSYRRENAWRKPGPGMFLQAAADLALDLARSWCIGDKPTDIEAGRAAGVGTLVRFDPAASSVTRESDFWIVPRLGDALALLHDSERTAQG